MSSHRCRKKSPKTISFPVTYNTFINALKLKVISRSISSAIDKYYLHESDYTQSNYFDAIENRKCNKFN